MRTRSEEDLLDLEILDGMAGLFGRLVGEGEALAKSASASRPSLIKALHMLDNPLAMKDLGRRMHCDPLVHHRYRRHAGAAWAGGRESDPGDRRVKRLVLTPAGAELKASIWRMRCWPARRGASAQPGQRAQPAGPGPHHEPAAVRRDGLPVHRGGSARGEVSKLLATAAPPALVGGDRPVPVPAPGGRSSVVPLIPDFHARHNRRRDYSVRLQRQTCMPTGKIETLYRGD